MGVGRYLTSDFERLRGKSNARTQRGQLYGKGCLTVT